MPATNGIDTSANFDVDPTTSLVVAFNQLAVQNNWKKKSVEYKENRLRLITDEFSVQFGSNGSNLGGWQGLCSAVGIVDIPSSITQCKKVKSKHRRGTGLHLTVNQLLKKIDVNIFDLIDAARSGKAARTFSNTNELAKYSKKKGKVFPKVAAKQNTLLKFMLRRIIQ